MDTVARVGGDEFVVMLSELSVDDADTCAQSYSIAEKIRVALSEPYMLTFHQEWERDETVEHTVLQVLVW
jgi:GGDEF domain-containing protein